MTTTSTPTNWFAIMNGLPVKSIERANSQNVNINDIITYKVFGKWIYSVVTGIAPSSMSVSDIICEITEDCIYLSINPDKNPTTKGCVQNGREMYKVTNITYL
jgi:hypothetical protein